MRLRPGLRRGPRWKSLQRSPDTLAGFKGAGRENGGKMKGREGKGKRGEGQGERGRGGEVDSECAVGTGPPIG